MPIFYGGWTWSTFSVSIKQQGVIGLHFIRYILENFLPEGAMERLGKGFNAKF